MMKTYRISLVLRYTQLSCRPLAGRLPLERVVAAADEADALRQACLCLDDELETHLARVNAINVTDLAVEVLRLEPTRKASALWNAVPYPADLAAPRHLRLIGGVPRGRDSP